MSPRVLEAPDAAALATGLGLSTSSSLSVAAIIGTSVGIALGSALLAATFAFFGYVLEILIGIRWNTEALVQVALATDDDEGDDEP